MLAAIGASKGAKRSAVIHLYFNRISTAFFMVVIYLSLIHIFKAGELAVLVATDVAARGIDVTDVDAVFNYRCV